MISLRRPRPRERDAQVQAAAPRFGLALLFLLVLSLLVHRIQRPGVSPRELQVLAAGLVALWVYFLWADWTCFLRRDRKQPFGPALRRCVLLSLFPPAHLGLRCPALNGRLWLPLLGWRVADAVLERQLQKAFAVPMIVVGLLVIPVLAIEYSWGEWLADHGALAVALDVCLSGIWLAFCVEALLLFSVADSKWRYCKEHWLDLAIILLPIVQALPFARVVKLGGMLRPEYLKKTHQLYRLRGLAGKAWRGLLLLDLLQRIWQPSPASRLADLEAQLAVKQAEIAKLQGELEVLRKASAGKSVRGPGLEAASPQGAVVRELAAACGRNYFAQDKARHRGFPGTGAQP